MAFHLENLLTDVFEPEAGEVVTVGIDVPRPGADDTPAWRERREMAREWREAFSSLGVRGGFTVNPLLSYPATGANNADLPARGLLGVEEMELETALLGSTLVAFLTEFSATAPLSVLCARKEDLRAASMPGIEKRMENTALAADYREGERPSEPSGTEGRIPIKNGDELVVLAISRNQIQAVEGDGPEAARLRDVFAVDPARRNIAEVAFGCNEKAQVTGVVLEDEKAGFHWAFGRSDHLGGTVGPDAFVSRETVVHQDIVYAAGNPIQVAEAVVVAGGRGTTVLRDGTYVIF